MVSHLCFWNGCPGGLRARPSVADILHPHCCRRSGHLGVFAEAEDMTILEVVLVLALIVCFAVLTVLPFIG